MEAASDAAVYSQLQALEVLKIILGRAGVDTHQTNVNVVAGAARSITNDDAKTTRPTPALSHSRRPECA